MQLQSLKSLSSKELLQLSGSIIDELVERGVNRTGNNPLSDYAEWLVACRLNLKLAEKSEKGFDAEDTDGRSKYEIKARRVTQRSKSRQLSAIRNLNQRLFEYLVAVVFDSDYEVILALKIPHSVVTSKAKWIQHTNSHKLEAKDGLRNEPGVEDITSLLK